MGGEGEGGRRRRRKTGREVVWCGAWLDRAICGIGKATNTHFASTIWVFGFEGGLVIALDQRTASMHRVFFFVCLTHCRGWVTKQDMMVLVGLVVRQMGRKVEKRTTARRVSPRDDEPFRILKYRRTEVKHGMGMSRAYWAHGERGYQVHKSTEGWYLVHLYWRLSCLASELFAYHSFNWFLDRLMVKGIWVLARSLC